MSTMETQKTAGPTAGAAVNIRLLKAHTLASFGGLIVSAVFGLLVSPERE